MNRYKLSFFNYREAEDTEFEPLYHFEKQAMLEWLPEDPFRSLETAILGYRSRPTFMNSEFWLVYDENKVVGRVGTHIREGEDNKHMLWFDATVLPFYRQQGIGKMLLQKVVETAVANQRRLVMTDTCSRIPAGEIVAQKYGFRIGSKSHTNQLLISELNNQLLNEWMQLGETRAAKFSLVRWDGAYPEEEMDGIMSLIHLINTMPTDDMEVEDMQVTREQVREQEASFMKRGIERWVYAAKEKETGEFAGYTVVFWNPEKPHVLLQEDTAVFPHFRNNGLGKWLKAAMLKRVLDKRPQVTHVRTGNADSNAPMLKINNALGFKPFISWIVWQLETENLKAALANE